MTLSPGLPSVEVDPILVLIEMLRASHIPCPSDHCARAANALETLWRQRKLATESIAAWSYSFNTLVDQHRRESDSMAARLVQLENDCLALKRHVDTHSCGPQEPDGDL